MGRLIAEIGDPSGHQDAAAQRYVGKAFLKCSGLDSSASADRQQRHPSTPDTSQGIRKAQAPPQAKQARSFAELLDRGLLSATS